MKHIIRGWIASFITLVALGGSTTASSYTIDTTSSPSVLTGLWWNANESGWGLTVTQQYGIIFVAMYTYDAANNPIWYVITNCPAVADGCTGDIYKVGGGSALTSIWRPNLAVAKVGSGTLTFANRDTAKMVFVIDGISGSKAITRQVFATAPVQPGSGFPILFKAVRLDSLTLIDSTVSCDGTLSVTNVSGTPINTALLFFDVLQNGVQIRQTFFGIYGLAPGASVSKGSGGGIAPTCDGITLRFNPIISVVN